MENLREKFRKKIAQVSLDFTRGIMDEIEWNARLIGIKGARGVGKTTLLLQYIKKNLHPDHTVLYVSLDDIWFANNKLTDLADIFVKNGGKYLFLDEVHKYPDWSRELKNIYDDYAEIKVVFTGSSLLEILNARADLSRRTIVYRMQGLSFREYLNFVTQAQFSVYSLENIMKEHENIVQEIILKTKPIQYFQDYLRQGYYPFFKETPSLYHYRIEEILNMIVEVELPLLRGIDVGLTQKVKQLLLIISESAPFIPNISKLSDRIGINRNTLIHYLYYLQEADIIKNLYKNVTGLSRMQKPDKIYLENANTGFAINPSIPDKGNMRETFFLNQVGYAHQASYPEFGDFLIDQKYLFEIGGKNKTSKQIKQWPQEKAFMAVDDIEYGEGRRIPLWLFGFLY